MTDAAATETSRDRYAHHFDTAHLEGDLRGRSARGGAMMFVGQITKFSVRMGSTMILARLLAPSDFGLVAAVTSVTGFVAIFKDAGLSHATVQKETVNHAQVSTLFWINVGLSLALTLVVAALSPVLATFYSDPRLVWITLAVAGTFSFAGVTVQHHALLRRQMRFRALAIIEAISFTGGALIGIAMAYAGLGYWSLLGISGGTALINAIAVWIACDWRPGPPKRGCGVGSMVKFGGHLSLATVMDYMASNVDNILIGRVWGPAALGLYSKAYGIILLPLSQMDGVVSAVALPGLARLQSERERFARALLRMQRLILVPSIGPLVAIAIFAEPVIRVMLGDQWLEADIMFRALTSIAIVQLYARFVGWTLVSLGKSQWVVRVAIGGSTLALVAIAVGLPWGPEGVAIGLLIINLFWNPVIMCIALRAAEISVWRFVKELGPVIAPPSVLLIVGVQLPGASSVDLLTPMGFLIFCGVALLGVGSTLVGRAAREDLVTAIRDIRGRKK
ncbi:MAG: lipopolysaccharide biosynthesis protein [Planctomycetota bacterium]